MRDLSMDSRAANRQSLRAAVAVSSAVFVAAAILKVGGWEDVRRFRPGVRSVAPVGHGMAILLRPNGQPPDPIWAKMAVWERQQWATASHLNLGSISHGKWPAISVPLNIGPIVRTGDIVNVRVRAVPLMLCSAVLPLVYGSIRLADARRRRRWARAPTSCRACGYDLRATPGAVPGVRVRPGRSRVRNDPDPHPTSLPRS